MSEGPVTQDDEQLDPALEQDVTDQATEEADADAEYVDGKGTETEAEGEAEDSEVDTS